jgi:murein DD-endopeptidase MepM/ murein hydrolase activator NlpD
MAAPQTRILAQTLRGAAAALARALSPARAVALAALALSGVAAFGIAPDTTLPAPPVVTVVRALDPPELQSMDASAAERFASEGRIRRGDTVGSVLARLEVDDPDALAFLRSDPAARPLYSLRPGQSLAVETDGAGLLLALRFVTPAGDLLTIARDGDRFVARTGRAHVETRLSMGAGEIRSSLFAAADEAGLPDAVSIQLADVFAADIDFYKDLQRGDTFAVVWEARYIDGEAVAPGKIVAAEFVNRGKARRAFLFRDPDGHEGYYAADGEALKRAFLRSPMEFSRVTSGFSNARFHPILQSWRAHRGVDYAAPVGTPVRATGNGVVAFAGRQAGYGNVIVLRHGGAYSTLYAHLSRFAPKLRVGTRVDQGEVVGFVGQTGWATGPHLHYEFRVGDVQRNPLTIALPGGQPLPASLRGAFAMATEPVAAQLSLAQRFAFTAFAALD